MNIDLPIWYNYFLQTGCLPISKEWFRGNLLVSLCFFKRPGYSVVNSFLQQVT
ncbi:hypothetical protein Runsl_3754 [Runella slithyformis DSM 19594]|uniref:Uncharacterized protein n=1 Tax=Runella slithyformis (strain ATCC 29530 / DSM 19594 / LMG 11500 / NCIMB 11436 / LSU 4) TaxID=761193 RepID=A0A7U3ZMU0_RUNSL|nr:hypothetical protein Runsl_3754 [Runella slithyformis DSM 19594]